MFPGGWEGAIDSLFTSNKKCPSEEFTSTVENLIVGLYRPRWRATNSAMEICIFVSLGMIRFQNSRC